MSKKSLLLWRRPLKRKRKRRRLSPNILRQKAKEIVSRAKKNHLLKPKVTLRRLQGRNKDVLSPTHNDKDWDNKTVLSPTRQICSSFPPKPYHQGHLEVCLLLTSDISPLRDGSAVEIVGLSWSAVSGLAGLGVQVYSHQQVPVLGTLAAWAEKIRENFDKYFWIGSKAGAQVRTNIQAIILLLTRATASLSRCLLLVLTLYCPGWVYLNV